VQDNVHDEFVRKLADATTRLKSGDGMDPGTDIGPLIDAAAVAKVSKHVSDALAQGASIAIGGAPDGRYFQPTILTNVTPDMLLYRQETFGPLAAVVRFSREEEVLPLANDSEFGLAAYFYTRDLARVWRVAEALET